MPAKIYSFICAESIQRGCSLAKDCHSSYPNSAYTCTMKNKTTGRRTFITAAAALGAAAIVPSSAFAKQQDTPPLIHHAIFWLKQAGSVADRDKLAEGVKTLAGIRQIKKLYVGIVAATEKRDVVDQSWGVSEIMFFDNLTDQANYQKDPIHLAFIKNYSQLWEKVIVYDAMSL